VVTPPDPTEVAALAAARTTVLDRIAFACARAGRDPAGVTLVAVSKTVDAERLRTAVAAGLTVLGENRVQEGETKRPEVPGARWELIGPLQSNKARKALETFERIQTVDSVGLAERLDRLAAEVRPGAPYPILVQVNVDDDPAKAGLPPTGVGAALDAIAALPNLVAEGLMTIGRFVSDPEVARSTFAGLRELSSRLRDGGAPLGPALSMGMTDDYGVAVEEGATIVRVGRALFGERPHHHVGGSETHTHPAG
jgi:pyridoxal phosphate enzyme (YggS family)